MGMGVRGIRLGFQTERKLNIAMQIFSKIEKKSRNTYAKSKSLGEGEGSD